MMKPLLDHRKHNHPVMIAAAIYFGIVFGVGFLFGSVRVPFLVPQFGVRVAELAELPLMFVAIFLAAGHIVKKHDPVITPVELALVGGLSLCLLVAAELLMTVALTDRSVRDYIASRDHVSGSAYLIMLLVFTAMPWLRRRRSFSRR